jgi:NAD(P)-dependent dehydrogenase (short-subunit alcohol dehydrogenase family)
LINNAGTKETKHQMTEDGFEYQWQVNYLGPFFFTMLLLPLMVEAGSSSSAIRTLTRRRTRIKSNPKHFGKL